MIIPVIFSLAPICDELLYSWSFYKGVDIVKHYGWPLFAQRQYFEEKEKQREKGYYSEIVAQVNDMEPYSAADDEKYIQVEFPEEVIQQYIAQFPSQTDAYLATLGTPWQQMTEFMVSKVRKLEQKTGEKAEAFLCLCDTQFIRDAARQLNIDILHYEWAPFRGPAYRSTAYLDLTGNMCDGELSHRYEEFRKISSELPIFNRREILAFFLNEDNLHYAYEEDPEPEYEAGLGFGYNVPWIFNHLSQMTSAEMFTKAEKVFGSDQILVRYHPGDPIHADLRRGIRDTGSLIEFLQKSRRILCNTSGLAYEAMLFNRPVYELGQSQYKSFTNTDLQGLPDHIADDSFLSFVAFGYCIPFELLKSVQYLRWRISRPNEKEIYLYHLHYYMNCLGIPESILTDGGQARFKAILEARRGDIEKICSEEKPLWVKSDEVSRLYMNIERYKKRVQMLESDLTQLRLENGRNKQEIEACLQENERLQQGYNWFKQEQIRYEEIKQNQDITIQHQAGVIRDYGVQQESLKRRLAEVEGICNDMERSKSWRITKPLRIFTQWVRSPKMDKD